MTKNPLVSIVIPTRSRAHLLDYAIRSALNQTYRNIEVIIQDNNSTDNTPEIVEKFLSDDRVKYYRSKKDLKMQLNWERAISYASGQIIVRLDDDCVFYNNFIKESLSDLTNNNADVVMYSMATLRLEKKITIQFPDKHTLYDLSSEEMLKLEFYSITESNSSIYKKEILELTKGDESIYTSTLPDRYINYRIMNKKLKHDIKVLFSPRIAGISRLDYRDTTTEDYIFSYEIYKGFPEKNEGLDDFNCLNNFQAHRALTIHKFFQTYKNDFLLKKFENFVSYSMLREYAIIGHLRGLKYEYKPSLMEFIKYFILTLYVVLRLLIRPFTRIDSRYSIFYSLSPIKRLFKILYLLLTRGYKKKVEISLKFGNEISESVVGGKTLQDLNLFLEINHNINSFIKKK